MKHTQIPTIVFLLVLDYTTIWLSKKRKKKKEKEKDGKFLFWRHPHTHTRYGKSRSCYPDSRLPGIRGNPTHPTPLSFLYIRDRTKHSSQSESRGEFCFLSNNSASRASNKGVGFGDGKKKKTLPPPTTTTTKALLLTFPWPSLFFFFLFSSYLGNCFNI